MNKILILSLLFLFQFGQSQCVLAGPEKTKSRVLKLSDNQKVRVEYNSRLVINRREKSNRNGEINYHYKVFNPSLGRKNYVYISIMDCSYQEAHRILIGSLEKNVSRNIENDDIADCVLSIEYKDSLLSNIEAVYCLINIQGCSDSLSLIFYMPRENIGDKVEWYKALYYYIVKMKCECVEEK